jgi:hypothetical protein
MLGGVGFLLNGNILAENQALHTLARQMANQPQALLKSLVEQALALCRAVTAGASLLETTATGVKVFRGVALAGAQEAFEGGTTPGVPTVPDLPAAAG